LFIAAFIEISYLSILVPLVRITTSYNETGNLDIPYLSSKLNYLDPDEILIILYILSLIFVFCFTITIIILKYKIIKFTVYVGIEMSNNLFRSLLLEDYRYAQIRDAIDVRSLISIENNRLINQIFIPFGNLIYGVILSFAIFAALLIYNPVAGLVGLSVVMILYYVIYSFLKRKIIYYGNAQTKINSERLKLLESAFSMLINIKLNCNPPKK